MRRVGIDPVVVEDDLGHVAKLWTISRCYVGIARPVHLGPLALRLTLWAVVGPFLLHAIVRLRRSIDHPAARQALGRALAFGTVAFAGGILWGLTSAVVALTMELIGVVFFAHAMAALSHALGADDLSERWRDLPRFIVTVAVCWAPAVVLLVGDFHPPQWAVVAAVGAGAIAGVTVLFKLAAATQHTRSWLRDEV